MGAYYSFARFSTDPVYKSFFLTVKPVLIDVAVVTNMLVFFLLLVQVIRHKKWKYSMYWCFIWQSAFDSFLAGIDHPDFVSLKELSGT